MLQGSSCGTELTCPQYKTQVGDVRLQLLSELPCPQYKTQVDGVKLQLWSRLTCPQHKTQVDGVKLQLWARAHLHPVQDTGRWCEAPAVGQSSPVPSTRHR
jgi:hypothetical protein